MLKQRVITALVLLGILLPALFYPSPQPFCIVMLVLIAAGGWEWGRLNGFQGALAWLCGGACLAMCLAAWAAGWLALAATPGWLWPLAGGVWVLAGTALLKRGVAGWPLLPRGLRLAGGLVALSLAWLAAAQARVIGVNLLLSVLALVWVADIAAYFAGRALGLRFTHNKLAPSISPGKSWEGVWGGLVAVVALALVWVWGDTAQSPAVTSFYSRLLAQGGAWMVLAVLFMGAMSVVGDLVESLVKRAVGVKDSSGLLPGHGGVLDRVDALLPTLPLAMMLISFL